jgi:hypothetical protein
MVMVELIGVRNTERGAAPALGPQIFQKGIKPLALMPSSNKQGNSRWFRRSGGEPCEHRGHDRPMRPHDGP